MIGADVGGTAVKLGLFSAQGSLLEKRSIPTDTKENGTHILPDAAVAVREMLAHRRIRMEQVAGLGAGVPGPVDAEGLVHGCVNLGWGTVDVSRVLTYLLPEIPNIAAANDADAAALGELYYGGGKGYHSAVMLTLGTGVGGGIVLDGGVLPGYHGAAGELGHMTVNPEEKEPCACGKRGCLEQYASANGLVRAAKRLLAMQDTPSPLREMSSFSSVEICDLARTGDALCLAALDRCGEAIGRALSFAACTVDPEVFILGGGLSQAGDVLFEPIRAYYQRYAFSPCRSTPVVPASLGSDAGVFGCAGLILRQTP